MNRTAAEACNGFDAAEVRAQLQRIVQSEAFRRSERLKKFLEYVCELKLAGKEETVNEYLIGTDVFDRGPEYSPAEDSIVRRQARSLRQKLASYYAGPGAEDPLRIRVPKGGYVPIIERNEEPADEEEESDSAVGTDEEEFYQPVRAPSRPLLRVLLVALLVVASFLTGFVLSNRGPRTPTVPQQSLDPALAEIWGPWLDQDSAMVCFSNPLNILVKHYPDLVDPGPGGFRLPEDEASAVAGPVREFFDLEGGHLYLWPDITAAKMGEAMGALSLGAFLGGQGVAVHATQSRFLDWQDFRQENLIVLGHNEQNPWVDPLLRDAPLQMRQTSGDLPRRIVNTKPRKGELDVFELEVLADAPDIEYALISMLQGIDDKRPLLLIGGLNTQVGQAAMEFLTDAAGARGLLRELRRADPEHQGPWLFQAVLRTESRDKVPAGAEIVYVRVLDPEPTAITAVSR